MSKEKNKKSSSTVLVAAGDSLTQASFSSNYLSILAKKLNGDDYTFINSGEVGDTSESLLNRIHDVIAHNPNFITILIGANDARQDNEINVSLKAYRKNIEKIIFEIRSKMNVPIALISLSPLGENPHSDKNKTVERYNLILKDIASEHNLTYLPFYESLISILYKKTPTDTSQFKLNLASALLKSAFQKYILRRNWDKISDSNGFSILTDGIHLNDKSGNILAGLIQEWLLLKNKH